jgi:hypothetical protein
MNPNGILLIKTWVRTQPINILIKFTMPMNYIKIIFLQDKCPLGQLSYESIWCHKEFQKVVIVNQSDWVYHKNNIGMKK